MERILLITSYYPEFVKGLYRQHQELAALDYEGQRNFLLDTAFALGDAYSANLRALGYAAEDIICDADVMQRQWAREHGLTLSGNIHDQRRQIVAAQVADYKPDVVLNFEWSPLGDRFLCELKGSVPLLVGQVASTLRPDRTYAAYDVMLSAWPPIVEYFRRTGKTCYPFKLGFDERVLDRLGEAAGSYGVTFVGGFAPAHHSRIAWLERILEEVPVEVFGYGIETVPEDSPIHEAYRGPAWGWQMYEVLRASRVTLHLNAEIEVEGVFDDRYAVAMRYYEATGVGTCLVAEHKDDLPGILTPGKEIATYCDLDEGIALIKALERDKRHRNEIARAGQLRTLADHTYAVRMRELKGILTEQLSSV